MSSSATALRFDVLEPLGRGATGEVFRAYDPLAGRFVALKRLRPGTGATPAIAFQFQQEFRAALSLKHPHLVEVYDFGTDSLGPYFTMELVEGPPVSAARARPVTEVCDLLAQLLLALDFLHARGILHQDVKPDNLRFTSNGELKLLDLGLHAALGATPQDSLSGTLAYLPPEALTGRPLSATSDLYAVGILAYELLTGEHPFPAPDTADLIHAHLHAVPRPLGEVVPGLPPELGGLVASLLAKHPGDRPQRASDANRALARWLSPERQRKVDDQAYTYLLSAGLVGRQSELAHLERAIASARRQAGGAVFIGAPAGTGKSRLVREFRLRCQLDNLPLLEARCPVEGGGPYHAVRQIVQALGPLATEAQRGRYPQVFRLLDQGSFEGRDGGALSGLLASLLIEVAAQRPLVICLDDLQWADELSLRVISNCLYEHRQSSVLWLGTFRSDEVGPAHPVVQAVSEGLATRLELASFTDGELGELVTQMLGTPTPPAGLVSLLADSTHGNGFFVTEMLRFLVDRGLLIQRSGVWELKTGADPVGLPERMEAVINRRVANLSAGSQALARLGAVLASDVDVETLRRLWDRSDTELMDALNELLERGVWQNVPHGFRFGHDRIREAVYEEISPEFRRDLHQRAAERLDPERTPAATLAQHRLRGHRPVEALPLLRQAGNEAHRLGALEDAFRQWKQAADLLEAHPDWGQRDQLLELWLDIGMKCGFSVDSKAGETALEKALAQLERIGHPDRAARLMGHLLAVLHRLPAAWRDPILRRLSEPVAFRIPTGWRRWLPPNYLGFIPLLIGAYTYLMICYNTNGQISKALAANRRAQRLVPDRRSWAWGVIQVAYAYSRVLEGRFDESIRVARESFELLRHESRLDAVDMSCASLILANNQVYQGEAIDEALRQELSQRSSAHHMTEWQGMVQYAPMVHYALTGRVRQAFEAIAEAQPFSRRCGRGTVLEREICLATARAHAASGQHEAGLAAIAYGKRLDEVVELPYFTSRLFEIEGRIHLERGELSEAETAFREVITREEGYGLRFTLPEAYLGLSEVARQRNELFLAEAHLAKAAEIVADPEFRCPIKKSYVACQRGRLAASQGKLPEARQFWRQALALAHPQGNVWQCGQIAEEQARFEESQGFWNDAVGWYHEAQRCFSEIELASGVARVGAHLERLSGTMRTAWVEARHDGIERFQRFSAELAASRDVSAQLTTLLRYGLQATQGRSGRIARRTPEGFETVVARERGGAAAPLGAETQVEVDFAAGRFRLSIEVPPRAQGETGEGHLMLLRTLVDVAGVSLERTMALEEAERRLKRAQVLNQTSLLVARSLDLAEVLSDLLSHVLQLIGAELALVVDTAFVPFRVLGRESAIALSSEATYSVSAVARVVSTREPLCVLDTETSEVLAHSESIAAMGLKSIMVVPIEVHDSLLGVLYVSSRVTVRTFTSFDLDLLRAIAAHAALALHNARQVEQMQEKRAIEHELTIAHAIQQGFFPSRPPQLPGLQIQATCQPAREVGGDFYDVVSLPDGRMVIALGDVSGKSISAALYMAVVRTALRMALRYSTSPDHCLSEINRRLAADITDHSFVTCFLGVFDPVASRFLYASAGHHLGFVWRNGGHLPFHGRGVPLGMDPADFDRLLVCDEMALSPGDRLVLFTDGVIEALSPDGEEFGEIRIVRALADTETAQQSLHAVLSAVGRHVESAAPHDDLTLLVAQLSR